MMRKCVFSLVLVLMCFLGLNTVFAYVPDGDLSDWGVTPFTDWVPDSATADYVVENNTNRPPSDGFNEIWDIEAMYFDDDADYLNFAIVSSNSYEHNWAGEDLGITFKGDTYNPEFGADVANVATGGAVKHKNFYSVTSWKKKYGIPYKINSGTKLGTFELYNRYLGQVEDGTHWKHTYVLEGRISRLLFGDIACGAPIELIFSRVTCLKDWISLDGTCDGNCPSPPVIPEPATMLLLGSGLLGLGGLKFKKKKT